MLQTFPKLFISICLPYQEGLNLIRDHQQLQLILAKIIVDIARGNNNEAHQGVMTDRRHSLKRGDRLSKKEGQMTALYHITGGPTWHERVSPKTWPSLHHFHDNLSEVSIVIATDQP
jgi:hypothetical protein